jgi:hypothetical protein
MNEKSILTKLDDVLTIIGENQRWQHEKLQERLKISNTHRVGTKNKSLELNNVLEKLIKDGYVRSEDAEGVTKTDRIIPHSTTSPLMD